MSCCCAKTGLQFYITEKKEETAKANEGMEEKDLIKKLTEEYEALKEDEKAVYIKKAEECKCEKKEEEDDE